MLTGDLPTLTGEWSGREEEVVAAAQIAAVIAGVIAAAAAAHIIAVVAAACPPAVQGVVQREGGAGRRWRERQLAGVVQWEGGAGRSRRQHRARWGAVPGLGLRGWPPVMSIPTHQVRLIRCQ